MNNSLKNQSSSQRNGRRNSRQQRKAAAARSLDVAVSDSRYWGTRVSSRFPGIGFPDELRCTLKYKEDSIAFAGLTPAAQVFRINSLFDPNLTGIGHQPLWFDQLVAVYGKYLVTAARVEAEIVNLNSTNGIATCVATYDDVDNSTLAVQDLEESRYSKTIVCGLDVGPGVQKLVLPTISLSKLLGQKDIESDPDIYALISANPADPGYYIFKAISTDATNNIALRVNFCIYFDCIFKELGTPASSLSKNRNVLTPDSRNDSVVKQLPTTVGVRDIPTQAERDRYLRNLSVDRFHKL